MKAATEQKSVITLKEFAEMPWPPGENGGCEQGQEHWLRAEQHEIAEAAWQIWEHEGRQDGQALAYWLRAEQQLLAARRQERKGTHAVAAQRRNSLARVKNGVKAQAALARLNAAVPPNRVPASL
jgi:hypothetical protein